MKNWLRDNRSFLIVLACFGFMRTAIADWNPIPSGSMRPTLIEGDVVLVNRLAYDFKIPLTDVSVMRLGEPRRGDVVTFTSPADGLRLIKRVVALPGDTVEVRDHALIINGHPAGYQDAQHVREPLGDGQNADAVRVTESVLGVERRVQFFPSWTPTRNFGPVTVGIDQFMMMGDSRDNSVDSRIYGLVPRALLIGRAHRILVSGDVQGWRLRTERVGKRL